MIKLPDETLSPTNNLNLIEENESEKEKEVEIVSKEKEVEKVSKEMSEKEIFQQVENKRYELDANVFDIVTKNQIEEKKIEDLANDIEDEESKAKLLDSMKDLIEKNEGIVNEMKEYVLNLFYRFYFYLGRIKKFWKSIRKN